MVFFGPAPAYLVRSGWNLSMILRCLFEQAHDIDLISHTASKARVFSRFCLDFTIDIHNISRVFSCHYYLLNITLIHKWRLEIGD